LGTACTTDHVQKLFRFTDKVVFSFDGDAAGRRAARKALDGALPYANDTRSVKFLFLPAEHDPDSYIRTFGQEAFSRYVLEAVPLSRFLIDSARDGCDLNTAEGRAHLASNAKPLWMLMPDGALKRQLLGELAEMVGLSVKELSELWDPAAPQGRLAKSDKHPKSYQKNSSNTPYAKAYKPKTTRGLRQVPNSRADHATRLLLSHSTLWSELSNEDHELLSRLPGDHGALFTWLEGQLHEHGALPWAALREGLREHALEGHVLRLMGQDTLAQDHATNEVRHELRHVLDRMLVEHLKVMETQAIEEANIDPQALGRYRALLARRRELESQQSPAAKN
jgi:DNA primase